MAMNIKNERVHALAREAAQRAGTTQTSVLEAALEQYLEVLRAEDGTLGTAAKLARARDIVHQMRSDMTDEERSGIRRDLQTMYDADGLPA